MPSKYLNNKIQLNPLSKKKKQFDDETIEYTLKETYIINSHKYEFRIISLWSTIFPMSPRVILLITEIREHACTCISY